MKIKIKKMFSVTSDNKPDTDIIKHNHSDKTLKEIHLILAMVYTSPLKYKRILESKQTLNQIECEIELLFQFRMANRTKNGLPTVFKKPFEDQLNRIHKTLKDLTRYDQHVDASTLTREEQKQALQASITKFIELHDQQPKELEIVLSPYSKIPLQDYMEVLQKELEINEKK